MNVETISLCVIARNEEEFLPSLLHDFLQQTYPKNKTEIILINGMSTDGTRSIMETFAAEHQAEYISIQVKDNPKQIQAAGWNVAIDASTCDALIRIDAHTHIPPEFTALNVRNLSEGEYVSGGTRPCLSSNKTKWGNVLLAVENSFFGSSINISRRGKRKEYVKTMFHAAYRKEVFDKAGKFNENLLRTEDNEMHYRIRQAGYRFCFDPEIISYQYARNTLRRMIRQKYSNGYWIALTLGVCPGCISVYHLVPALFVLAILVTTLLSICGFHLLTILMWGAYGLFTLFATIMSIISGNGNIFSIFMPFLFLLLHVSYGVGTLVGLVKMPSFARKLKKEQASGVE